MSVQDVWLILSARKWLVLASFALTLGTTALITFLIPPRYAATSSVVLDYRSNGPFQQTGLPDQMSASYVATQIDIIQSHSVALRVVDALKLTGDPAAQAAFVEETGGQGTLRDWLAASLVKHLTIYPSRDSRLIDITFSSTDPNFAAAVADAFAQAYIDTNLALSIEPARRSAAWFDGQLKLLRQRVEDAHVRLTTYQREHGIVTSEERLDSETRRLDELTSQLVLAENEANDVKSQQLGINHPEYQRAVQRLSAVRGDLGQQKGRLLALKRQRDQIAVYTQDLENAQKALDTAAQRYAQTNMEGQFNQTNIALLSKAVAPTEPSSPRVAINLVLGAFLGLLLGAAVAFLREMADKRVRAASNLGEAFVGLPMLGTF